MWKKRERSKPELDRPGGSQANSPEAHEQQRGSADKPSGAAPLLPCCSCRRRQRRSRARRGRRRRTSIGGRYRFLSRLDENVLRACNRAAVCCAGAEELLRSLGILVLPEKVCHNIASCATTTNLCSAVLKGVSYLCALNLHVSKFTHGLALCRRRRVACWRSSRRRLTLDAGIFGFRQSESQRCRWLGGNAQVR